MTPCPATPLWCPPTDLARTSLPGLQADWLTAIEAGWIENVGR